MVQWINVRSLDALLLLCAETMRCRDWRECLSLWKWAGFETHVLPQLFSNCTHFHRCCGHSLQGTPDGFGMGNDDQHCLWT